MSRSPSSARRSAPHAFTLVELIVSMVVLAILFSIIATILGHTQRAWERTRIASEQFRESRLGFETMTDRIAAATLNPRWENQFASGDLDPNGYRKVSDLHFLCGPSGMVIPTLSPFRGHSIFFIAPFGQSDRADYELAGNLLNGWGYGISYGPDTPWMPGFVASGSQVAPRYRFRLMEYRENTEDLRIFPSPTNPAGPYDWCRDPVTTPDNPDIRVLAENVIALIILPMRSDDSDPALLAPNYYYDTRASEVGLLPTGVSASAAASWHHELPPLLRVTMVAVGELSANRLPGGVVPNSAFTVPTGLFQLASNYEQDLETFEDQLRAKDIEYRVFTSTIPIRSSKWSKTN